MLERPAPEDVLLLRRKQRRGTVALASGVLVPRCQSPSVKCPPAPSRGIYHTHLHSAAADQQAGRRINRNSASVRLSVRLDTIQESRDLCPPLLPLRRFGRRLDKGLVRSERTPYVARRHFWPNIN